MSEKEKIIKKNIRKQKNVLLPYLWRILEENGSQ